MPDILFPAGDQVFSYRVAGICVQEGKVLLQKPEDDDGFAFPGGHVSLGETNAETLTREFREEIGAEISVGPLRWVGELFFPWGERSCHQICLYYAVRIVDGHTPRIGSFPAQEQLAGQGFPLIFHWIPLERLQGLNVYPPQTVQWLLAPQEQVQLFIYRE